MVNIRKLLNREPYDCIHTAIGELCVFYISHNDWAEIHKELGKPISKCDTEDFIRKFVQHTCFPKSSLREGKYKPYNPVLTNDDISSLAEVDLESIAKLYIAHNEHLFKKPLHKKKKDDKGKTVNYIEYGEIEYPRYEEESYVQYLTRLSIKEEEKRKKLMEKISGLKNFSSFLGENIRNTLSLGDSLRRSMEGIRPIHNAAISPIEREFPNIDLAEIQEGRLEPFNELSKRLDKLIEASVQTAEFMAIVNETQTKIAGEIKSSGDQAAKFSKKNVHLTYAVITLTTISLLLFVFSVIISNIVNRNQRVEIQENVNMLAEKLTDINNSITVVNDTALKLLKNNYGIMNESLRLENDSLKKQITEQSEKIDEMKTVMQLRDKKLKDLEKKPIQNDATN